MRPPSKKKAANGLYRWPSHPPAATHTHTAVPVCVCCMRAGKLFPPWVLHHSRRRVERGISFRKPSPSSSFPSPSSAHTSHRICKRGGESFAGSWGGRKGEREARATISSSCVPHVAMPALREAPPFGARKVPRTEAAQLTAAGGPIDIAIFFFSAAESVRFFLPRDGSFAFA